MKAASLTLSVLIGLATMSFNTPAAELSVAKEKSVTTAPLVPERFIPSINDDRNLDFQTVYPEPDAKGIQIMKNSDMVIDTRGNLYVTGPRLINDEGFGTSALSKITPDGVISILTLPMNEQLTAIAIDSHDNIYLSVYSGSGVGDSHAGGGYSMVPKFISDLTSKSPFFIVRKLQPDGKLSIFIPKNKSDCFFNFAVDGNGVLYSDSCSSLIKISKRRGIGSKKETLVDFSVGAARMDRSARAMVIDGENNLIYAENSFIRGGNTPNQSNNVGVSYDLIKKISPAGDVTDIAGIKIEGDAGVADKAGFKKISSLTIDSRDNIYVLEPQQKTIRKITNGVISTLVNDTGEDAMSIAIHGDNLYILRESGIDVVRNLSI